MMVCSLSTSKDAMYSASVVDAEITVCLTEVKVMGLGPSSEPRSVSYIVCDGGVIDNVACSTQDERMDYCRAVG